MRRIWTCNVHECACMQQAYMNKNENAHKGDIQRTPIDGAATNTPAPPSSTTPTPSSAASTSAEAIAASAAASPSHPPTTTDT